MSDGVPPDTPPTRSEPQLDENDPSKMQQLHQQRYTVREEEVAPSHSLRPPSSMNKKFTFFRRESIRPESRDKKNLPPSAKTHSLESELHRSSSPSLQNVTLDAPIPGIENSRHRFRPVSQPSSVELKQEQIDTVAAAAVVDAEAEAKKLVTPKKHKSRLRQLPTEARAKKKQEKQLTPQEAYELSIKVGQNQDDKKKPDETKRQTYLKNDNRSPSPSQKRSSSPTKKKELQHEELETASPVASPAKGSVLHVSTEPEPVIQLRRQSSSASQSIPPSPSPQLMQQRQLTDSPALNTIVQSPLMQRLMQRRESNASIGSPERSPSPGQMLRQASIFLTEITHGDFSSSGRSSPSSRSYRRKKHVLPEVEMVRFSDIDQDPIGVRYKDLAEKCCKYLTLDSAEDLEIFSQYFTSEDNKQVIKHMFWFVFCAFFQQGDLLGQNVEQLIQQLSVYATRVAWSIPHEHNDKFFSMYHTALAYSVIKAMRKHFTGSKKKFTANWQSRVLELVSELVTGIRLKKSLLEEQMDKLFNKQKRKKREAEKRRKERDEAAKAPRKMSVVGQPKPRDFYSSDEDDAFDAAVEDEIFITDDEFSANLQTIGKDDVPIEALQQGRGMTQRSVHFAGSSANTPRTRRSSAKEGKNGILKKASIPNSAVSSLSEKSSFSASTTQLVKPSRPHTQPATPLPALSIASSVSSSRPHSRESSRSSISEKTERERVQEKSSPRYETDAYRSLLKRLLDKTSWDGSGVEDKFFVTYAASPLIRTSGIREPTEYYKRPQAMCLPRGRDVTGTKFFSSSMEGHRAEKREAEFRDRWENPRSMQMLERCMAQQQIMDRYLEGVDQRLNQQMQDIADRDKENATYRTAHYNRIRQEPSGEKMRVLVQAALQESSNKHFPPQVIAEAVFNNRSMKVQAHILYEQERNNAELKSALHDVQVQLKRAVKQAKKKRDHQFRKQLVLNAHKPKFDVQVP